ncbi:hypothetical protein O4H66_19415 [Comamonadaceae bacterium G21597-S1]|nr:hypothetical protein [Comamonadaceae bacterium G21597-S1]
MRGGLFYGQGTDFSAETNRRAREGLLQLPGQGQHYVSLVHVDDMAEAIVLAAESDASQMALNIVDDHPVRWRELLGMSPHGMARPRRNRVGRRVCRVSGSTTAGRGRCWGGRRGLRTIAAGGPRSELLDVAVVRLRL